MFGEQGELTISSEGYIAGNKFKITKEGSAEFNDLKARANVDLGNIKKITSDTDIDLSGTINDINLDSGEVCNFGVCEKEFVALSFISRAADYITISLLKTTPSSISIGFFIQLYNSTTLVEQITVAPTTADKIITLSERATFDNIKIIGAYLQSQKNNLVDFEYNIKNSTLTDVQITNLINPTSAQDPVTRAYLEDYNNISATSLSSSFDYSLSGGTLTNIRKYVIESGIRQVTHIVGIGTITSGDGGEMVITLTSSAGIANASNIIVSPYRDSSAGSEVDIFYGFRTSATVYRIRHDWGGTVDNKTFTFHIIGYD